jgi:hypothetical protein
MALHGGARGGRSGRRVAHADTPEMQPPACGKADDQRVAIPADWQTFAPPGVGQSYVDPAFGCRVVRLTDSSHGEALWDGSHSNYNIYYSTFTPMNASDTMLMIPSDDGGWRIINTSGKVVVAPGKMPKMNNGHLVWDATEGNSFYYTLGNTLYEGAVSGDTVKTTTVHEFKEYKGIVSPDSADLSQDGDHIALVGQNANSTMDVFVWSLGKKAKTATYTTACKVNEWGVAQAVQPGCVHKLQLTPDNQLGIQFAPDGKDPEEGLRLWRGGQLVHLQNATNHYDDGYDLDGNAVFIEVGNSSTLPGESNPCPSGWGLDVRQLEDLSAAVCLLDKQPAWHVSYRGDAKQPWAALSFFDDRKVGPELLNSNHGFQAPSAENWHLYEDEIVLARIDGGATYRLAHARTRSAENYWYQPHAAISRDGKYVIFGSDMAYVNGCPAKMHVADNCADVYMIRVK